MPFPGESRQSESFGNTRPRNRNGVEEEDVTRVCVQQLVRGFDREARPVSLMAVLNFTDLRECQRAVGKRVVQPQQQPLP